MMSSTFPSPIAEHRYSPRLSDGHAEGDHVYPHPDSLPSSIPFLLCPPSMDPAHLGLCTGPLTGPRLLPYLAPFHHHGPFSVYDCPFEPAFIQKRNERERQRVKCVNQGYAKLRDHLPGQSAEKRLSKVETLRAAISYIKYLQGLVQLEDRGVARTPPPGQKGGGDRGTFTC